MADTIRLNEFLPVPKTNYTNEWIELANDGDAPADLAGWALDDGQAGGAPYQLPPGTLVAPRGLLVVSLPKPLLNNNGDTIRLLRPDGSTADQYEYGKSEADTSFCLIAREWRGCAPTPGRPNRADTATGDQADLSQSPTAEQIDETPEIAATAQSIADSSPQPMGTSQSPEWSYATSAHKTPYALATSGTLYQALWQRTPTIQPSGSTTMHASFPTPHPDIAAQSGAGAYTPPFGAGLGMFLLVIGGAAAGYDRLRMRSARPAHDPAPVQDIRTEARPIDDGRVEN